MKFYLRQQGGLWVVVNSATQVAVTKPAGRFDALAMCALMNSLSEQRQARRLAHS